MTKQFSGFKNAPFEAEGSPYRSSSERRRSLMAYPAVPVDEIAFALAIFVGAANGQLDRLQTPPAFAESEALAKCKRIVWGDSAGPHMPVHRNRKAISYERTLESALLGLWRRYSGEEHQASICLRILNFYRLTAESAGSTVERWVQASPAAAEEVLLHPALVQALARVSLGEQGRFAEDAFFALVGDIARKQVCE